MEPLEAGLGLGALVERELLEVHEEAIAELRCSPPFELERVARGVTRDSNAKEAPARGEARDLDETNLEGLGEIERCLNEIDVARCVQHTPAGRRVIDERRVRVEWGLVGSVDRSAQSPQEEPCFAGEIDGAGIELCIRRVLVVDREDHTPLAPDLVVHELDDDKPVELHAVVGVLGADERESGTPCRDRFPVEPMAGSAGEEHPVLDHRIRTPQRCGDDRTTIFELDVGCTHRSQRIRIRRHERCHEPLEVKRRRIRSRLVIVRSPGT